MDERCQKCPLLCKRLAANDQPEHYAFLRLTPEQVIETIESNIKRYSGWHHFIVEASERSCGNQLVTLLRVRYAPNSNDEGIVLIAQSERTQDNNTDLWFRYGVPPNCCQQPAMLGLTRMIEEILESLRQHDWLVATR